MGNRPQVHQIYRHFKGDLYQVAAIARHWETGEELVVYQELSGERKVYADALAAFTGKVNRRRYPDAAQEDRFVLAESPAVREPQREAAPWRNPGSAGQAGREEAPETDGWREGPAREREEAPREDSAQLDPLLLEFLDADSYETKLNVLAGLRHRMTDRMLTTMAVACDLEVKDGELEERYTALRSCLLTRARYERSRPR
ncbi:MAG: DUF1653 domain-containing protein [Clostridium sp.]|jgi:hypothetical protein|nr:DUF1653 domain-containing protein [Clostridium sp.]